LSRVLLQAAIPVLLPFVLYFVYVYLVRRRSAAKAEPVPWSWLAGAGLLLAVVISAIMLVLDGAEPGRTYIAPHYEGGKIVPGHFE
jgi:hypothetical protein